ncbi:hypothetical protein [Ignicoccus hospitalis]|uniref:hypothetical protein n=1 Tax=Ignicoccus hospitalis TaxID=160233 RepID=UPI0011D121D4|nr:hypothetical protein [Ignicoccus hospitalis]HIH90148.1 hypothetical protein [Desulfurococcaceae archaeon]
MSYLLPLALSFLTALLLAQALGLAGPFSKGAPVAALFGGLGGYLACLFCCPACAGACATSAATSAIYAVLATLYFNK